MTLQSANSSLPISKPKAREVTRHISREVSEVLWGMAAGRCEFRGCNQPLWKSAVTQEQVKLAERAHIYAFGERGPRSKAEFRAAGLNGLENLMLVCRNCHGTIDQHADGGRYTAEVLQGMKREHEMRVELVTGIVPSLRSHLLLFSTSVGEHQLLPNFLDASAALFPQRLPASNRPIELGSRDSASRDHDEEFWRQESAQLTSQFEKRVRERIQSQQDRVEHLSVFAIAPQPLLVLLGTLLGDILPARVHQRRREPTTWMWGSASTSLDLVVEEPAEKVGAVALVLSLSGTVKAERITEVLGKDVAIWHVTVAEPHNDLLQTEAHLAEWRSALRKLFDRIKAAHGQSTVLHIFPAIPAAAAVEMGRVRMPKADMPWQLYDQNNRLGGFVRALPIP